jgi:hypothetical protein
MPKNLIYAFTELRCSAISSSPITIDHTVIPSLTEHITSDFMDTHSTYQPLIQRTSMGNDIFVKCPSSVDEDNGSSCSNDAQNVDVATGTKGLLSSYKK